MRTPLAQRRLASALSLIVGLGLLVSLPAATLVATAQPAQAAVATGDVVFTANGNIWLRRSAGGSLTQLTFNNQSSMPDVSPDGSRIVYLAPDPNPNYGQLVTWIMNSDGSGSATVDPQSPTNRYGDYGPRWSPDGTKIVVKRNYAWGQGQNGNGFHDLFVMSPDGTNVTQVTHDGLSFAPAAWSPDSQRLAFTQGPGADMLTIINIDGTNLHSAAVDNSAVYDPAWSPDGSRIYVDTTIYGLFYFSSTNSFATATATPKTRLTVPIGTSTDELPRVSADGATVLFDSNGRCQWTCGPVAVYTVPSTGGTPVMLSGTNSGSMPAYVPATWPAAPSSNATATFSAPSPSDAPYTRQVTVNLSATGNKRFDLGWSTSSTTAPNTSYLQQITNLTTKKGPINFLGKYSGSGNIWNGGTQPDQNWYLWVRSVKTNSTANAWASPRLLVHTPKRPVWVAVGDSYSSGHHQDTDEPYCPSQSDTGFPQTYINCPAGGLNLTPNDLSYSWVKKAVDGYNAALHAPTDPTTGWSYGLDLVAVSGAPTSTFGVYNATPGTDAWASDNAQSYSIRADLYSRYNSWPVVSMTGGANDTNWVDKLSDFYKEHFTELSPVAPWAVSTANPSTDCPDSQSVWDWLKATQLDGQTLDAHIQANLQGIVAVATRYAPSVRVINMGYPYVVNAANSCSSDSGTWHGSKSVIDDLNANHAAVVGTNVHYISLTATTGFGPNPVAAGYLQLRRLYGYPHPVDTGQTAMANLAVTNLLGSW